MRKPREAVMMRNLRTVLVAAVIALTPAAIHAETLDVDDWESVLERARGQHVHWYAWGGEAHINDYIAWVGEGVAARHGVRVTQVKLADTAEAVARVLAEAAAGQTEGGAVDLIWINGENFVALKEAGLLRGDRWAERLPHRSLVDLDRFGAAILTDFAVPVDGAQSPWGRAQLSFLYDSARVADPPASLDALVRFAADNPGRFTFPQPPDFVGTSFLKQVLLSTVPDPSVLREPAGEDGESLVREHLLPVMDALAPNLWRSGRAFPQSVAELRRLFADGELFLSLTHNPSDAEAAIRDGLLPPTVRVGAFEDGTLGNVHFVTIPANAGDPAGALVVANFLLSPQAQARKADPSVWGDPTVLDVDALPEPDRGLFAAEIALEAPTLAEPHASWTPIIERVWSEAFLR